METKLKNSNYTTHDLWYRPKDFLHDTVTVKKKINTTPLRQQMKHHLRGTDTADMANYRRPAFLRSNPQVYIPDFDMAEELLQEQQGQKVHLSDNSVRAITGVNTTVKKLEKMLDNPSTLTDEGFQKLVDAIKKLTYPDREELDDAVSKKGSALAARVLDEVNKIAPPTVAVTPSTPPPRASRSIRKPTPLQLAPQFVPTEEEIKEAKKERKLTKQGLPDRRFKENQ